MTGKFVLDGSRELGRGPSDMFLEFTFLSNAVSSAGVHHSKLCVGSIDASKDGGDIISADARCLSRAIQRCYRF